jgi:class 3 adenylate cyclase/predicted ATPase
MPDHVSEWLEQLGLEQYASNFSDNDIDAQLLAQLKDADLKEIGISSLGHRKKILGAIETLDQQESEAIIPITSTGEAERRQLTVMFCDLAGSTELSQRLDPEDLREVNRAYQDACKMAIERYDGYVARYMGDGVLAYFGFPHAHEDDAERAVHAGLAVVKSVAGLNIPLGDAQDIELGVRVGIATGPVVVGDLIGEAASQESAVVGETPNLAARLQAMTNINCVVIGPETHDLAGGRFEYEDLGDSVMKGIAKPVRVWRVIAPSIAESRFEAMHRSDVTPLVGRQSEIGLLLERWEYAKEGDGQVVFFSGEPGIGKSRITEALCEHTIADDPILLRYQCSAYHLNSALHPVIEQLERTAGFNSEDLPDTKLEKLESLTSQASHTMTTISLIYAQLLSIPVDDRYAPLELSPEQLKRATLDALILQMEIHSKHRPVLLVFEDVHWSDPTSLELLGLIVSRVQTLAVLVIITFRLEFSPPWNGPSHITSLRLNRFSRSRAVKLIERVSGGKPIPSEVCDRIIEKADGVPLFLEELTKSIIESELIEDKGSHYALTGPMSDFAIPNTLNDSLMSRLDRSASMREVAQVAAVIGREFSHDLLAAVSTLTSKSLEDALDRLIDATLIFRDKLSTSPHYVFKHALVQNAAYESLLKAKRRDLHARIAKILDEEFPDKADMEPELLAHHYTEAGLGEPARRYWLKAGQQGIRQSAHAEAIAHLQRGLSMVETLPDGKEKVRTEIEFRVALGVSLLGKEGAESPIVGENYLRAQMLCEQLGESEHLYPVIWGLWFHRFMSSGLRQARELADLLLEVGQNRNDTKLLMEAHHCQWAERFISGDLTTALEHCDQGTQLYRPDTHHALTFIYGGHDPGVCALGVSGALLWLLGYSEQSREKCDLANNLATELTHSSTTADSLAMDLVVCAFQRDEEKIEKKAKKLLMFTETEQMAAYPNLAEGLIGWVMFQRGDNQEGLKIMREAAEGLLEKCNPWSVVAVSLIAESLGQMGEVKEGLNLVEDAISLVQRDGVHWCEAELYRVKGKLLLNMVTEASSAAEDAFKRAMEIARAQNAKALELRAAVDLASMWKTMEKKAPARELLSPIYEWFTEGFDTADLRQAKALLENLT